MTARGRIPELDGLRAIAILCVFVHHALSVPLLWMGVDLFFVLSGFLITGILLERKESGKSVYGYFYERRARRIIAPYVLLLAISSLLFGPGWTKYWYWYAFFGTNIGNALGQSGHQSLGPLWSLAVEEQFYLVWPVVVLSLSRSSLLRLAMSALVIVPLLRAVATPFFDTSFPIFYLTPFRMDLLCAGAAIAVLFRNQPLPRYLDRAAYAGFFAAGTVLLFLSRNPGFRTGSNSIPTNTFLYTLTLIIAASLLLLALTGRGPVCRLLRWTPVRWIGTISYSMYLVYMSVIVLFRRWPGSRFSAFFGALAVAILYSAACWYGFEKRLLNPKKTRIAPHAVSEPA